MYKGEIEVSKQNDLNVLLNQEPKQGWIKKHPTATNVKYIPIGIIEFLLTNIYIKWRVEILREGLLANSVYCAIRLHYKDPVTNEWDWVDGIGGAPLQTDKDAGATDWTHIKSSAVMIGLPAAESYAIKDAAEKLGKLFGKDLNRKDTLGYDSLVGKFDPEADYDKRIKEAGTKKDLADIFQDIPEEQKGDYVDALSKRKAELK